MFGEKPKELYSSPLDKGDHPELNTSDLLDADGIQKYQSMIGAMQWAISIGCFLTLLLPSCLYPASVSPRVLDISNVVSVSTCISARCDMLRYEFELMSLTSQHFRTSLMIGHSRSMATSRRSSQRTVQSCLESMLHFRTTLTRTCIMTCFQDVQLLGFSTSSTSVPLIGTPRNRVQSRQQHLGLK